MPGCYSCGNDVSESHAFCPHCGVDDPNPADHVCPSCNQDVGSDWVRCPLCGTGLQTNQGGLGNQVPQSAPMGGSYGRPLSAMSFMDALKTCFKDKYFDFSGRASRSEFWWCYLGISLLQVGIGVLWGISLLIAMVIDPSGDTLGPLFFICSCCVGVPILFGILIPYLGASVRRLHDVGYSGWWLLINFVPLGGIILLVWFCTDGEPHANIHGPVPTNVRVPPVTNLVYQI